MCGVLYIHFYDKHELFERYPHMIFDTTTYFKNTFRPEWLSSDLAKEMIFDVDKSVVESPYCIMSPIFGQLHQRDFPEVSTLFCLCCRILRS